MVSQNKCYGSINIGKEYTYEGEFLNGRISGIGKFIWHTSKVYFDYVGEFKNDRLSGKGKLSWINGDMYIGDFENGKEHGFGKKNI